MFSPSTLTTIAAFFASASVATPVARATDPAPTGAFILAATSLDSHKYLNATLLASHSAASTENLVTGPGPGTSFTYVKSDGTNTFPAGFSDPGYIDYFAPGNGQPQYVHQYLHGIQNASSNVEAFQFGPTGSDYTPVKFTFSPDEELFYASQDASSFNAYNYFYICPVYVEYDKFETLSYVADNALPDNEACDRVSVKIFNQE